MATFDDVARRQLGLLTTKQLATFGWSRRGISRAVTVGRLVPMRRGVYRLAGTATSVAQVWMAAVLAADDGRVIASLTAARHHAFEKSPDPWGVDLLREGPTAPRGPGIVGHHTDSLPASHRTILRGIPTTTPARTVIDICGIEGIDLGVIVRQQVRLDSMFIVRLTRAAAEVPVSGRRAIRPIRELLRLYVPGLEVGDSDPEFDLAQLLVANDYPRPTMGMRVRVEGRTHKIDCGWPDRKAGFEYQSDQYHLDPQAAHDDNARLRRLKRAGYDIWPITSQTDAAEILAIAALIFGAEPRRP